MVLICLRFPMCERECDDVLCVNKFIVFGSNSNNR